MDRYELAFLRALRWPAVAAEAVLASDIAASTMTVSVRNFFMVLPPAWVVALDGEPSRTLLDALRQHSVSSTSRAIPSFVVRVRQQTSQPRSQAREPIG